MNYYSHDINYDLVKSRLPLLSTLCNSSFRHFQNSNGLVDLRVLRLIQGSQSSVIVLSPQVAQ